MHQITRAQKARANAVNTRTKSVEWKRHPNKFDADSKHRDGLAFFVPAFFSLALLIVPIATAILAFDFLNQEPTLYVASNQIEPAYRSRTTSKKDFIKKLNEAWVTTNAKELFGQIQYVTEVIQRDGKGEIAHSLAKTIVEKCVQLDYDPLFVAALIRAESTFDPMAVSNTGALGLMQVLPSTGEYITEHVGMRWEGKSALHDPEYNVEVGINYLKYLDAKYNGDRELILIAYNWGPGNVYHMQKGLMAPPQVTTSYKAKILNTVNYWEQELRRFENRLAAAKKAYPDAWIS